MRDFLLENYSEIISSPYFALAGFAVGLVGLILAIVFYLLGRKEKKPMFQVATTTLVEGVTQKLGGLSILFNNCPQERIAVSKVAFWNNGKETITSADIADADPIRLIIKDVAVFDVKLIRGGTASNRFSVGRINGTNEYTLNFDFVDYRDYCVIQVVHDGDENTPIYFRGKIKGCRSVIKRMYPFKPSPLNIIFARIMESSAFYEWATYSFVLFCFILAIWFLFQGDYAWYVWILILLGLISGLACISELKQRPPVKLQ